MNLYAVALFLHIAGALGFFVVMGLEWIGLSRLRDAGQAEEAGVILRVVSSADRLGFVSMPLTIITGFYMVFTAWGFVPWILVVLGALILETALFVAIGRPGMAAIAKALSAEQGALSRSFSDRVHQPVLWISVQVRTAIILGIVFLKIAKPGLGVSLLVIAVAILLGAASALPGIRTEPVQQSAAD